MKRNNYIVILAIAGFVLGCSPEDFKPIGEPANKVELMNGTWTLSKLVQTDVNAANKGFPMEVQQMELTNIFPANPFTDLSLTFNSAAKSFSISKGNSLSDWPASGTWDFDNPSYPSKLFLYTPTDTIPLGISNLSKLNAVIPSITFRETKKMQSGNKVVDVIYYDFSFTKQ